MNGARDRALARGRPALALGFPEHGASTGERKDLTLRRRLEQGGRGRAVLAVPETDAVIPPEVTGAVPDAPSARSRFTRFGVRGAEHMPGPRFESHAEAGRTFVDAVPDGWAAPAGPDA
ncbi:hypothetical protein ACFYZU_06615 [Streptomyces sp. NPDC001651]|uniref:hypothetical protein n=1 Tax=Streptomyces sp. NPDC001651 TaxID=3364596 RepID=UPI0036A21B97